METILIAVISAIIYTFIFYVKKEGQEFDKKKFAFTACVGIAVGLFMWYYDVPITQLAVEQQVIAYAGLIALAESAFKGVYRILRRKLGVW